MRPSKQEVDPHKAAKPPPVDEVHRQQEPLMAADGRQPL